MTAHDSRSATSDSAQAPPPSEPSSPTAVVPGSVAPAGIAPVPDPLATPESNPAAGWLPLLALVAVFVGSFWPTLVALNARWSHFDGPYSHGYLVLAMVGYFLWLQRERLRSIEARPALGWSAALALCCVAWSLSEIVEIQLGGMLLLPLILLGIVLVTRGWKTLGVCAFPLLLLYVAIPVWEDLFGTQLRNITALVSGRFLEAFATFPAHVDGYSITISYGTFYVADGCSGLSFFLTGITLGLAYGYLNIEGLARRAAFLLFCVALSVISNWIRVTSLVYIGQYTQMQSSLISEGHLMYGWFVFAAAMVLMLWVGYRMSAPPPAEDTSTSPARPWRFTGPQLAAALLPILLAPALVYGYELVPPPAIAAPALPAAFVPRPPEDHTWRGFFHGTPTYVTGDLASDRNIGLLFVHYDRQVQKNELVSDLNRLDNESTWTTDSTRKITTDELATLPHALFETELRAADGSGLLVWHWNALGGHPTGGRIDGKLTQLRATLLDRRADGTFVALTVACSTTCDAARQLLRERVPPQLASIDAVVMAAGPAH